MLLRNVLTLSSVVLMIHLCPCTALGYALIGVKWSNKQATFYVNTQYGPSGSLTAFQNALQTWSEVDTSSFEFMYGGTTSTHAFGKNDGVNRADFGPLASYLWGYTYYWYSSKGLLDADVRLNVDKAWGTSERYDVETVALHELGHALGLGHSSTSAAVMHHVVDSLQHDLHSDDINGISRLYPAVQTIPDLEPGNLNADNKTDLVYVTMRGEVYYSTDLSSWTPVGSAPCKKLAIADFNGDGLDEIAGIAASGYVKYAADNGTVLDADTLWIKVGSKKFKELISGDFNGDGVAELAGINLNGFVHHLADNSSTWGEGTQWQKVGQNKFQTLYRGDFDGDGKDELAGINENAKVKYASDESSAWNESTQWITVGDKQFKKLTCGDFDGDGIDALAGINENNKVRYISEDSSAWDANTQWPKVGDRQFKRLAAGDFNANGLDELVGINMNKFVLYVPDNDIGWDEHTLWSKVGTKKFKKLAVGDFNGDGKDDLAGVNDALHVLYTTDNSSTWDETTAWTRIEKP